MAADWIRTAPDTLERGIYRIEKSHIRRLLADPAPIYHCHAGHAFIGVTGDASDAMALCDRHAQAERSPTC
jgi:hypothetical protein